MCYSSLSVEVMNTASNYFMETELCDLMQADELGQIMPDYPEGYIVISAGGATSTEIQLVLSETGMQDARTKAA